MALQATDMELRRAPSDPHSLHIVKGGKHVGFVMWHLEPCVTFEGDFNVLSFYELGLIARAYEQTTGQPFYIPSKEESVLQR